MSGKSLEYWRKQWDAASDGDGITLPEQHGWKLLELLKQYSGVYLNPTKSKIWGGSLGRFLKGRWGTHNGNKIQVAISDYFDPSSETAKHKNYYNIEVILVKLKKELAGAGISHSGDLTRILKIAQEEFIIGCEGVNNKQFMQKPIKVYEHKSWNTYIGGLPQLPSGQDWLLHRIQKIVSPEDYEKIKNGCCHGISMKARDAFLKNHLYGFIGHLQKIQSIPENTFADGFAELEETEQKDIKNSINDIIDYHSSQSLKEGQAASFCGSYNQAELKSLLHRLSNALYNIPITMVISCGNHSINLSLDPISYEWLLIDPNYLPIESFAFYDDNFVAKLAESLERSLFGESQTIFSAVIYTDDQYKTRVIETMSSLRKDDSTWQKLHAVKDEKINKVNTDQISWFYIACTAGQTELVKLLLGNNTLDPNKAKLNGVTPFFIACQNGHKEIVELLLDKADINKACENGTTPFYFACQDGDKEIVELLLGKVDINIANKNGTTPFHIACKVGHKEIIELLLDNKKLELNKAKLNGATPFYTACSKGYTEIVDLLLDRVDINKACEGGTTPFHIACKEGHKEIIELLLGNKKLEPNKAKLNGATPFYIACQEGHKEIVELLLDKVNINIANKNGVTPFYIACQNGHKEIVELLLGNEKLEANKAKLRSGFTPFHIACQEGNKGIVEILLANEKVDPNQATIKGATPFYIACQNGHFAIVEMFLRNVKDIDIDTIGDTGHTPLQVACLSPHTRQNKELFKLLINNGASLEHKNDAGQTALEIAKGKKNTTAIKVINEFLKNKKPLYTAPSSTAKLLAESWQKDILLQSNDSSNQVVLHKTVGLTY